MLKTPRGYTYASDAPLRDAGAWWERPEAVALRGALVDAQRATKVLSYSLHDVLPTTAAALRSVAASADVDPGSLRHE